MARYIDADALKEKIESLQIKIYFARQNGKNSNDQITRDYKKIILSIIEEQETADVVPKSEADNLIKVIDNSTQQFLELHDLYQNAKREVERLEQILDCYALQYGTVTEQQKVIDKAKSEVARKIFEEIYRLITNYFTDVISRVTLIVNIAELKKKYTEEQQ